MEELVRLNKFVAANGVSSRRKIDEMIEQGRVTVNGNTIVELGYKIHPSVDKVALDGEQIKISTKKIYIMLNKPEGVITSVSDEKHRPTVIDIVKIREKIFPVGRLDYNTTGLLLLTNDGELSNKLMHPKGEVYKTYFVTLSKPLEEKHRIKLTGGVELEGKKTAPSKIRYPSKSDYSTLYISIYEGRNRQVRKMFENYGYFVRELQRTEYAGIKIGDLKPGEWRTLTDEEVKNLIAVGDNLRSSLPDVKGDDKRNAKRKFTKYGEKEPSKRYNVNTVTEEKPASKGFRKFDKSDGPRPGIKVDRYGDRIKESKPGFKSNRSEGGEKPGSSGYRKFDKKDGHDSRNKVDRYGDRIKDSKWGFKTKQTDQRNAKLGFTKTESRPDRTNENFGNRADMNFSSTGFNKPVRSNDRRNVKPGGRREGVYRKFESKGDGRDSGKDFKKFVKRDDKKDVRGEFKKYEKRDDKKDVRGEFKKYEKRDDKKDFGKSTGKFEKRDTTKGIKKDFKSGYKKKF